MAKASYALSPLALQEIASHAGMTHIAIVTSNDLTNVTNGATQKIKLADLPAGVIISKVAIRPVVAFEDPAAAGNDTTTASVGDSGSATRHFGATQLNKNAGGVITQEQLDNTAYGPYTAADELSLTFTPKAGTNLAALKKGELHVLVQIFNPKTLSDAKALTLSNK
jgi:hypothetical protein